MSDQTSEFHIAQQSRRERLRIINSKETENFRHHQYHYRNVSYDPSLVLSSCEMINLATNNSSTNVGMMMQHSTTSCGWNTIDVKPNFGYHEMQHSSSQGVMTSNIEFGTLEQVVTSATTRNRGLETCNVELWTENYIDQSHELGTSLQSEAPNSSAQVLDLSLSSVPQWRTNIVQMEKRPSNVVVPENFGIAHSSAVPLGPFTGYATILKSSKFQRPAQQLLDELCDLAVGSSNVVKCSSYTKKNRDGFRVSCDVNAAESSSGGGGCLGDSSGMNESSVSPEYLQKKAKLMFMQDEICKRYKQYHQQMQMVVSSFESVAGLSAATPYISLALKTVTQQFKSLRNAITDHLKTIRQALGEGLPSPAFGMSNKGGDGNSSRLKFVEQKLHNQSSGGGAGVAFLESQQHVWRPQRGLPERAVAILRAWLFDHFLHPYPTNSDKHMLASQTGLTRNQVSNWFINARVRVWKPMVEEIHMLETRGVGSGDQTGSSKRKSEMNKLVTERTNHLNDGSHRSSSSSSISISNCGQNLNNVLNMSGVLMPEKQDDCQGGIIGSSERLDESSDHQVWRINKDKRSMIECHNIPAAASVDGSLIRFVPYDQRNALEIRGSIGPVSLTLGLRQNVEAAQQQQLQLHEHHRLRQQFGGHMIHDFVD
ncbi:unnamed protein product [Withania somnifera]